MRSLLRTAVLGLALSQSMIAESAGEAAIEGDWRIECPAPSAKSGGCQMIQAPSAPDAGAPHFLMAVSSTDSGKLYGVVTGPLSVYLVPGVEMIVDRGRPFKAHFELCDTAGCHAGFRLSGQVLNAFRTGQVVQMRIWISKSRAIDVPVSLKGFSKGVQRLQGEGKP